ncbi:hypothetical protein WP3W18E01_24380 [Raoultella ornithinolytica]|uniref:DUF551 domain-containing protein n=1 Tax=Raoultella ornithinolytica TaxID=54291 RepID=UPI0015DBD728|nr:hypothetical protein WP3W18E01_24380 [Raoultella ornithinolytica]
MTSKLTITREQATDKEIQMLIDSHENGTAMFLRVDAYYLMAKELQECRKAELDSKPVAWTDEEELRDANESGSGYLFGIGHDANKFADPRRQIMLYLHAQQPVVPDDVLDALQKVARIRLDLNGFDGDRRGIADCLCDAEEALIEVVNRRAAMLQGAENAESRCGIQTAPALDSFKKNSESRCGNSPVIPDGYRLQPISEYEAMCATVNSDEWPQRWIPVSERMPEDRTQVILWDAEIGEVTSGHYSHKTHTFYHCGDAIQNEITHWMPLPADPQEVNHG